MKKTAIIILSAVILFGGLFIFYQNRQAEQKPPSVNKADQQANMKQKWESKLIINRRLQLLSLQLIFFLNQKNGNSIL